MNDAAIGSVSVCARRCVKTSNRDPESEIVFVEGFQNSALTSGKRVTVESCAIISFTALPNGSPW